MFVPLAPSTIHAHEIKVGDLVIVHPMADAAEKGQASVKGSVQIRNEGSTTDRLLAIRAAFAETAALAAAVPVAIPATGRAVSVAIVFTNLRQGLYEDAAYAGQLVFDRAGTVEVDFMVHSGSH